MSKDSYAVRIMFPQGQIGLQVRLLIFMAETDACDRVCILLPYPYSRKYLQFVLPSRLFSLGLEYFFQMSVDLLLKTFCEHSDMDDDVVYSHSLYDHMKDKVI